MPVSVVGRHGQVLTPVLKAVREALASLGSRPAKRGRG